MYEFNYQRPRSLEDALKGFRDADDAAYLAGGQTLIPVLKQRLAMPSDLIDLMSIDDLADIHVSETHLSVGAMTRHAVVASSSEVQSHIPALANLAGKIGDPHVRNRGTLGGSIANNDPAADYPAALVALDATVHTNERQIKADAFFTGFFETALEEGELVTGVDFPIPDKAAYQKFPNPASRYAMVGVFVADHGDHVRVAVTGAGACVFRLAEIEQTLAQNFTSDAIKDLIVPHDGLTSDMHGSSEYRAHLTGVLARRAVDIANGLENQK